MKWKIGYVYKGHYRRDRRHGCVGKIIFKKGEWYEGDWFDNLMEGAGVYRYAEGHTYKGKFIKGH
jgi:hypothetical protein